MTLLVTLWKGVSSRKSVTLFRVKFGFFLDFDSSKSSLVLSEATPKAFAIASNSALYQYRKMMC